MRRLFGGSASASASGVRSAVRANKSYSVGDLSGIDPLLSGVSVVSVTGTLLRVGPPCLRKITGKRGTRRRLYTIPPRDPLCGRVVQGNCVGPGHQGTIERADRIDKARPLACL